mmetsp:Transcript_71674/g.186852  ORF Transcript_71674/g.186852 Transcript_71674/m.186852 type:complete len:486 (+) Transcript_71674:126-1583(+)
MESCGEELSGVQDELKAVKAALRGGGAYLGMSGQPLQTYLLRLSEKENLLISKQLQLLQASDGTPVAHGGGASAAEPAAPEVPTPRPAPPGPPKSLDREDLEAVIAHLQDYESSPPESTKALRALSSLAYADASKVGNDEAALAQLLRLLLIHPDAVQLQLAAMRALCNMAYDHKVALARLAVPEVLSALVTAVAKHPEPKDVGVKASEALARIVAAETQPTGENGTPKETTRGPGALSGLFLAASRGGPCAEQAVLPELIGQLIRNEVVEPPQVAQRFAAAGGEPCSALTAAGWLGLAKQFCLFDLQELPQLMTDAGAIAQCTKLMEKHIGDPVVQLGGIEAMSSLVGNRWAGLQSFAEVGGMRSIEAAMGAHKGDAMIQTKGVRALSSGILWPEDIQKKSGYDTRRSMELTQAACEGHKETVELQTAALEALAKYVENKELAKLFAAAGGEQLVKDIMSQHAGTAKVKSFGDMVLTGVKRNID